MGIREYFFRNQLLRRNVHDHRHAHAPRPHRDLVFKVSGKYPPSPPYSTQKYARDVQHVGSVESIGKYKIRLFFGFIRHGSDTAIVQGITTVVQSIFHP